MRRIFIIVGLMFVGVVVEAGTQVVGRATMVVQDVRLESAKVVGRDTSAAANLKTVPGIIVNGQGIAGGQADLSIQGSSFSGAGLSLAGLALRSPQTEHFNAELPIAPGILQEAEVLSGFDQVAATEGHLVGTAAFEIMPIANTCQLTTGISEENGYWVNLLLQQSFDLGDLLGGMGLFGGSTEQNAVDNVGNELRSSRGGGQFQILGDNSQFDLIAAYQEKRFGARGYYGVTPDWDADEKLEDTLILASWLRGDTTAEYMRCSAMYRELADDYTLYWSLPGLYNNQHRTKIYSGTVGGRTIFAADRFSLDWRLAAEDERIRSKALGNHERSAGSLLLLPGIKYGSWSFKAGGRYAFFEDYAEELLPQGAIEYLWNTGYGVRLSHSQSVRQPSYTELNYESPASLGNAGLSSQQAAETELRLFGNFYRQASWHAAVFHRTTHDMVDWVRATPEAKRWAAVNLGRVESNGAECGAKVSNATGSHVALLYSFLHKSSRDEVYSSRYALDYPEHYLLLSGLWQICREVGLELAQSVRVQSDNPLRDSSDYAFDGFLALHVVPRQYDWMQLSLMVSNLWDEDFEYFPGQATYAPRLVSAAITLDW
jgi:iron complex outermembrane receptor protein